MDTPSSSSPSPPSYVSTPVPTEASAQPPVFRQRKSSTSITAVAITDRDRSTSSSSSSGSDTSKLSPTTSPVRITRSLPAPGGSEREPHQDSAGMDSNTPEVGSAVPPYMRQGLSRTSSNSSTASLAEDRERDFDRLSEAEEGESTPLLSSPDEANEGAGAAEKWWKGPLVIAAVKFCLLFIVFTAIVAVTFYTCLPKMEAGDKDVLKLPRSFADLQALNSLFQKYKERYPLRLMACGIVSYLFVQTFTLPGSMYISILFGAAYGIMYGLFLSCLCESFGSLLCYTLSSLLAPPLLALPFYRARVETWRIKIMGDPKKGKQVTWDGVFAFLIVLRIAPFPPHWIANFVAPHLGISPQMFWASAFIGIGPVSVIHCTIGSSLDKMTSAADFHLLSLRNILGLCAVVVAVLIPVGLKRVFKRDLGDLGEAEEVLGETSNSGREIDVPPVGENNVGRRYHAIDSGVVLSLPSTGRDDGISGSKLVKGKGRALEIIHDVGEDEEYEDAGETSFTSLSAAREDLEHEDAEGQGSSTPSGTSTSGQDDVHEHDQWSYEVYDPQGVLQRVEVRPNRSRSRLDIPKPYRPNTLKGYGAIEPPPMEVRERVTPGWGGWWPFGRGYVA